MSKSPAIKVAKNGAGDKLNEPIRLSTGVEVFLKPVPSAAITRAQGQIKEPVIPMQEIDGKEGKYPNPTHPDYIEAKRQAMLDRVEAGFDVMVILGIELLNGMPDDSEWMPQLKLMVKLGHIDISEYDLDDPIEKEFLYKRYFAMASDDWNLLGQISGITEEAIAEAKETFPGQA